MEKTKMLGVLFVITVSWLILWFGSKEHLSVLGLIPTRRLLFDCFAGFILTATVCSINLLWQAYFKDITYIVNTDYGIMDGLMGTWWTIKAVLFEEFIFRGVLLYLLIRKIGIIKACLVSALFFGIYHWFSYGLIGGRIIPMIYVLLLTGAGGWMFAYAFAKTKSLLIPIGLHFGWIFVSIVILSEGPLGNQLLIRNGEAIELGGWTTLLFFLWQVLVAPGIVTWYLSRRYTEKSSIIH